MERLEMSDCLVLTINKSEKFTTSTDKSGDVSRRTHICYLGLLAIEIEIVYNMYLMRRFTTITVCAGCYLWALPTMPHKKLTSHG
jgi:hypothetical protein